MRELEKRLRGRTVVDRAEVIELGGTDDMISMRTGNGWWNQLHAGVYRIGPPSSDWLERLEAALHACGPGACVSHRAAFVLWGLEGIDTHLVEVTVPYVQSPEPAGVILHRTRREMPRAYIHGLAVSTVERALLDVSPQVPASVLLKGVDSALRNDLTTPMGIARLIAEQGGPGVRGVRKLERTLDLLDRSGHTDSPAEATILKAMDRNRLPTPVLQWEVEVTSGRRYRIDFGWPEVRKGVEIDGLIAHGSAERLENDLRRQNDLLAAGIQLRRYTARSVLADAAAVASDIGAFLKA